MTHICMDCNKVRPSENAKFWGPRVVGCDEQRALRERGQERFSHGLCPACFVERMGGFKADLIKRRGALV